MEKKKKKLKDLWDEDSADVSNHLTHRVAASVTGDQKLFFPIKAWQNSLTLFQRAAVLRQGIKSKYPRISRPHSLRDDFSIAAIKSLCSKNSFGELTTRLIENSFVSESYSSFFAFGEKLGVTEK